MGGKVGGDKGELRSQASRERESRRQILPRGHACMHGLDGKEKGNEKEKTTEWGLGCPNILQYPALPCLGRWMTE